ncbi:hypothetical protein, partial [Vibrio sp. V40_P2S30T141]|uniref:hypothetical protein n=1 Tax=Vibrio sp. V40_P2S30T141 TaxID=1938691 RepID=UPI001F2C01F8
VFDWQAKEFIESLLLLLFYHSAPQPVLPLILKNLFKLYNPSTIYENDEFVNYKNIQRFQNSLY